MAKPARATSRPIPSATASAAAAERDPDLAFRWAALIYLALSVVYFLAAFQPGRQIFGTDYVAGGYPFYNFIASRLAAGALPKWVPYVFGGLPLAANPGSTYYPVHMVLESIFPVDKVLAGVFLIQFWVAGMGMFLLTRELGCRRWVSFVTGLAWEFTGITASWVYAGHDGRIIVVTWAPMVFFLLHRGIRTGRIAPFAGVAAVLGMEFLSFQIQNSYYVLLSAGIWAIFCLVHLGVHRDRPRLVKTVGLGLLSVVFGFALAAVDFLPFQDYVPLSPRAGARGYEWSTSYSMPVVGVVAMAVPEHVGNNVSDPETGDPLFPSYRVQGAFKLHTEYVGAFALVLLLAGAAIPRKRGYWWFFAGLSVWALTMAFGGNTPLYHLYYALLPGLKQFRAPDLIYFVIAMSVVTMAGLTLERLAEMRAAARDRRGALTPEGTALNRALWVGLALAALAVLGAGAASGGAEGSARAAGWIRFAFFAGVTGGVLMLWARGIVPSKALVWILAAVTVVDLWIIDRKFFHTYPGAEQVFASDDIMDFLNAQPGPSRVWTFPVPQQYRSQGANGSDFPMVFGVEQAGGEHPNPLRSFTEYLGAGQQTMTDWHHFIADANGVRGPDGQQAVVFRGSPGFLDAANVRYLVTMAPLGDSAFREVHRGGGLVYENTRALPRAYLVPNVTRVAAKDEIRAMENGWDPRQVAFVADTAKLPATATGPLQGDARVTKHGPDEVEVAVTASRPALLVLADNWYPGWVARVDGKETPIWRTNHTFRGIVVPAGQHTVRYTFEPADLYHGLWISIATAVLLVGIGVFTLVTSRRRREDVPPPAEPVAAAA